MRTRLDLLVISALALYRFWRLVARDDITAKWREAAYDRWPPDAKRAAGVMVWDPKIRQTVYRVRPERTETGQRTAKPDVSRLAALVDCPWCAGAWLSAVATAAVDASFGLTWPLAWAAALSTLVGLLGRLDGKGRAEAK